MDRAELSDHFPVKEEVEDQFTNDSKNVFGFVTPILVSEHEGNPFSISPCTSTKLEPDFDPIKRKLDIRNDNDDAWTSVFENDLTEPENGIRSLPGLTILFLKQESNLGYEHGAENEIQPKHDIHIFSENCVHENSLPFECQLYEKNFSYSPNLSKHRRTHTGEKPFMCQICGKRFTSRWNLSQHQRTHTGEKPFECEVCEKKFISGWMLSQHQRTHTGEKPFECEVCKRKFSQRFSLTKHNKRKHPVVLKRHANQRSFPIKIAPKKGQNL